MLESLGFELGLKGLGLPIPSFPASVQSTHIVGVFFNRGLLGRLDRFSNRQTFHNGTEIPNLDTFRQKNWSLGFGVSFKCRST